MRDGDLDCLARCQKPQNAIGSPLRDVQRAEMSLMATRNSGLRAEAQITNGGLMSVAVLVSSILLSTAVLVHAAVTLIVGGNSLRAGPSDKNISKKTKVGGALRLG
jgi:hypothetical protein